MNSSQRIFITGASGFVGREIAHQLLADGHNLTVLARSKTNVPYIFDNNKQITIHEGDVTKPKTLEGALKDHDAMIHLVGIIREIPQKNITFRRLHLEATENMIKAAKEAGVERFIHMSALGVSKKAKGGYFENKWYAEESLRASGLNFTIFRPSLIYGPGDKFTNMIADMIRKFRFFPLIGEGTNRMQPIAVEEVASGFTMSMKMGTSIGRTYEAAGVKMLQFKEIVSIIAKAIGVSVLTPAVSPRMVKPWVRMLEKQSWFPLTMNQLEMLLTDNTTENRMFIEDFGITPVDFKTGIARYLKKRK